LIEVAAVSVAINVLSRFRIGCLRCGHGAPLYVAVLV
jgi:hypothetical protein